MCHDLQDFTVGLVHGIRSDGDEIADALVDIVVDDAFNRTDAIALHGQHGRQNGCAHARCQFESAARFGAVANHAGEVGNHVLHGRRHFLISAAHQIGDAATGTRGGHNASAKGREGAEALLDVDGRQMAQHQGAGEFLSRVMIFLGKDHHGVGGANALVARSGIAHDGNHGTSHAGVASAARA